MKFRRVRVRAFGALSDVDTGPDPLPELVAIHAPNEGGKSTFFVLLSSLLYGFYPASRDRHPYAPWSGDDADADARIRLSDGGELQVHRRLLSAPWGRTTRDGKVVELANRTLPAAGHVRRELFEEVYALTLSDLARVDDESWQEIQDRLLGSLGAEDLRSTRSVVEELEDEAADLWRPDRRGKPRSRALRSRLDELGRERRAARERDRRIRETAAALDEKRSELADAQARRRKLRAQVERGRLLEPVRRTLRRIREEEERAGDPEILDALPDDPRARIDALEERARAADERVEELEARVADLEDRAGGPGDADRGLLERSGRVRQLGKMAGEVGLARDRLASLEQRVADGERRCREKARGLFDRPFEAHDPETIRTAPLGELGARVRRYREARERVDGADARLRAREEAGIGAGEPGAPLAGGLLAVAAGAVAVWGVADGRLLVAGAALAVALPTLLWLAVGLAERRKVRRQREVRERAIARAREELEEARRAAGEARAAVREVAADLPLGDTLMEDPTPELVHDVKELQRLLTDLAEHRKERERLDARVRDAREELASLVRKVEVVERGDFLSTVVALEEALEEAEERRADARAARSALEERRAELEAAREEAATSRERLRELRERLRELGDGRPERGVDEAEARMEARSLARTFRRELVRSHPDLDELKERIREAEEAGEGWTSDEEALLRAEDEVEALNREEKELIAEIEKAEGELRELKRERTLDRVEGEILSVRDELERVQRRRDRLALLAGLLRTADHRFREENQPDLLRSAGGYLERITGGRYRRLLMREGDLGGTLLLQGPGYPHPVEVDTPVSTGTREQVYLALRLAIVDHLDAGGERLPLFLDEAFVNWDARRRERGFELVADLARTRQIFVFTCHESMARSLEERGARLLSLPTPDA